MLRASLLLLTLAGTSAHASQDHIKAQLKALQSYCDEGLLSEKVCEQRQLEILRGTTPIVAGQTPKAPLLKLPKEASQCSNIQGIWTLEERGKLSCRDAKDTDEFDQDVYHITHQVTIQQDGCKVGIFTQDQQLMKGVLDRNGVTLTTTNTLLDPQEIHAASARIRYTGQFRQIAGVTSGEINTKGEGHVEVRMMLQNRLCPYQSEMSLKRISDQAIP